MATAIDWLLTNKPALQALILIHGAAVAVLVFAIFFKPSVRE